MTIPLKTPAAVRVLRTTYHRLMGLIRFAKIDPLPARDSSGHYVWGPDDLERARQALQVDLRRRTERQGMAHG
jgi:hypothetical protein